MTPSPEFRAATYRIARLLLAAITGKDVDPSPEAYAPPNGLTGMESVDLARIAQEVLLLLEERDRARATAAEAEKTVRVVGVQLGLLGMLSWWRLAWARERVRALERYINRRHPGPIADAYSDLLQAIWNEEDRRD